MAMVRTRITLRVFCLISLVLGLGVAAVPDTTDDDKVQLPAWCYSPPGDDCTWYRECLVRRHSCGLVETTYAIGYGETICEEFNRRREDFSDVGKQWIDSTRACLQKRLVPVLTPETAMTCEDIQTFAFSTHAQCFTDPPEGGRTFCDITYLDWFRAIWIVKESFVRETRQTVTQGVKILGICASQALTSWLGW